MKKKLLILCAALMLTVTLSSCSDKKTDEAPTAAPTGATTEPTTSLDNLIMEEVSDYTEIKTAYNTLYYPVKWQDKLTYKQVNEEKISKEEFYMNSDSGEYHLFDIEFGGDNGTHIGTVKKGDTEVDVNLVTYSYEGKNDAESTQFRAMLEDVNYLIDKLNQQ